jgi:cytosine/adenosine deaminase-related metal-dependent hydrolase
LFLILQRRTLLHGTTTASYFATIHLEATKELCRVIGKKLKVRARRIVLAVRISANFSDLAEKVSEVIVAQRPPPVAENNGTRIVRVLPEA